MAEPNIDRSTPDLGSLFQDIILEHYKRPRNKGGIENANAHVHMNNPTCGDEVYLFLRVNDGIVEDIGFEGDGCSISQASISMMTQILKGQPVADGLRRAERFTAMMHGDAEAAKDKELRDARALAGVSKFPTRVKCALLGWNAFEKAAE